MYILPFYFDRYVRFDSKLKFLTKKLVFLLMIGQELPSVILSTKSSRLSTRVKRHVEAYCHRKLQVCANLPMPSSAHLLICPSAYLLITYTILFDRYGRFGHEVRFLTQSMPAFLPMIGQGLPTLLLTWKFIHVFGL